MARAVRFLLAAGLALSASGAAAAEDPSASFPNRPIRMIVPFPAGGPSDIVARLIGQTMSQDWGQPVVIENRPGANTIIGAQAAAKAAPDGYTLFMAIDSTLVMKQRPGCHLEEHPSAFLLRNRGIPCALRSHASHLGTPRNG